MAIKLEDAVAVVQKEIRDLRAKYESVVEDAVISFLSLDSYGQNAVLNLIKIERERCEEQNTLQDPEKYTVVVRSARKKDRETTE